MALTPNLVRQAITGTGDTSTWDDLTVYGSGNPNRNEVALYLTAYKVDENLVNTALVVNSFDPEVVTQFVTQNTVDGHYIYYFVIVNNYDGAVTYTKYDLVWDTTQNAFYEYINDIDAAGIPVTNAAYWAAVVDPTSKVLNVGTSSESGNLIYQVIQKIVSYKTSICMVKAATQSAKEDCLGSGNCGGNCKGGGDCGCGGKTSRFFKRIKMLFTNMGLDESRGLYTEGEKNARLAEKYCDDCGCLSK